MTFSISDSPSDQIETCIVEVDSLRLRRPSGAFIPVESDPIQVDLAEMSDRAQVLRDFSPASGTFDALEVTLDFTNAQCVLANQSTPATLLDAQGNALTGQTVLLIEFLNPVVVDQDVHRRVQMEFDLDQSTLVDTTANTVQIEPALIVRVNPSNPKPIVILGRLRSVNPDNDAFKVELETMAGLSLTSIVCQGNQDTVYQVDGVASLSNPGVLALDALPLGTWIEVTGQSDQDTPRVNAAFVRAGAGTFNGGDDIVDGYVVDRTGGAGADATLTVLGRSTNSTHTTQQYNTTFTVNASFTNTKVVRLDSSITFDLDDVNVGQHIVAYGALAGTTLTATAADDVIFLAPTRVFGTAEDASSNGVLTMDLDQVGVMQENQFIWASSGSSLPDPAHFTIEVAGLDNGQGIVAGTKVDVQGYFRAVDDPDEDLVAIEVVNRDTAAALLLIKDVPTQGMTVVTTTTAAQIEFALTGTAVIGETAIIDRGPAGSTPLPTTPAPSVIFDDGFYGVLFDKDTGTTKLYDHFDEFSNDLGVALSAAGNLVTFGAKGDYDATLNQVSAVTVVAVID